MNIGVIQGRLSPPIEGFQECPVDWKREFDLLGRLGFTHIEWIVTKENFYTNLEELWHNIFHVPVIQFLK